MEPRNCEECGREYDPNSWNQKYCADCSDKVRARYNREYLRQRRRERGARIVGEEYPCSECGNPFVYKASEQHRCPPCQKRAEIDAIHEWLAKQPEEKLRKYRQHAADNYHFGGNRQAALERDDHECQCCGTEEDLHVHHIDGTGQLPPGERNDALDNLETLCRSCHTKSHHESGDIPPPPPGPGS